MTSAAKPVAGRRERLPRTRWARPHLQPFPPMLRWALIFLVLGLVAALFGFTSIAGAAIGIAKILFYVFLALFLVALLIGMTATGGGARR
jgi:uncharacterized membrane protein YtjA (UPF0391 family)